MNKVKERRKSKIKEKNYVEKSLMIFLKRVQKRSDSAMSRTNGVVECEKIEKLHIFWTWITQNNIMIL